MSRCLWRVRWVASGGHWRVTQAWRWSRVVGRRSCLKKNLVKDYTLKGIWLTNLLRREWNTGIIKDCLAVSMSTLLLLAHSCKEFSSCTEAKWSWFQMVDTWPFENQMFCPLFKWSAFFCSICRVLCLIWYLGVQCLGIQIVNVIQQGSKFW